MLATSVCQLMGLRCIMRILSVIWGSSRSMPEASKLGCTMQPLRISAEMLGMPIGQLHRLRSIASRA